MKVAFVLLDGEVTGGQVVARELMLGLRAVGHEAAALAPLEGPMLELLRSDGFDATVVPQERSFRLDRALSLARVLRRIRPDLVDTHTLFVGNQLARVAAAVAGVPLVRHVHIGESFRGDGTAAALQRRLERVALARAGVVVAVSHALRALTIAGGVPPERVVVVHNGVPIPQTANPAAGRPGLELVCAARLALVKGQDVLLEALALAGPGIAVSLVGEDLGSGGAYRRELEARVARLGLGDRVRFLGFRADLSRLLDESDALVLPSRDEGLPLVALEAMARARPVVAAAVGGVPELITDGETGLLVPPGEPEPLAVRLALLRDDPALRSRLGQAARARVERDFSVERMRGRTLAVYASVLGRRA